MDADCFGVHPLREKLSPSPYLVEDPSDTRP